MGGKTSSASKAKYNAKAYDRMIFTAPKGSKDELDNFIKQICPSKSRNQFISEAINEKMRLEQKHYDSLSQSEKWYRSEEGIAAIKKLKKPGE